MNSLSKHILLISAVLTVVATISGCSDLTGQPGPGRGDGPGSPGGEPSFLYVQYSGTGSFVLVGDGDPNHYTLTLSDVLPITTYFSDRPQRIAGTLSIDEFIGLNGLFDEDNPPNAAVTAIDPSDGSEGIVIVELRNPVYDWQLANLFYDAIVVEEPNARGLGPWQRLSGEALPRVLERINVFIDHYQCPGEVNPQCTD